MPGATGKRPPGLAPANRGGHWCGAIVLSPEGLVKMATSPVPQWAREMSPHHHGPTAAGVLRLALVVVLVALVLQAIPTTDRGGQPTRPTTPPPCATVFPPTCEGVPRGR